MPGVVIHYVAIKIHCIRHSFMTAKSTGTGIEKEPILHQMLWAGPFRDILGIVVISAEMRGRLVRIAIKYLRFVIDKTTVWISIQMVGQRLQLTGQRQIITIDICQICTPSLFQQSSYCQAHPHILRILQCPQPRPPGSQALHDGPGTIARAVIDGDHFKIEIGCLLEQAEQAGFDKALQVVHRHQYAEFHDEIQENE